MFSSESRGKRDEEVKILPILEMTKKVVKILFSKFTLLLQTISTMGQNSS